MHGVNASMYCNLKYLCDDTVDTDTCANQKRKKAVDTYVPSTEHLLYVVGNFEL